MWPFGRHRHSWRLRAARHMTRRTYYFGVDMGGGSDVTVFLYSCDCGRLSTDHMPGLWEAKDIGMEPMRESVT